MTHDKHTDNDMTVATTTYNNITKTNTGNNAININTTTIATNHTNT